MRAIITDRGVFAMRSQFNLYYLHWWTLTHFIFEEARHREHALALLERGGGLPAFEQTMGPVAQVQFLTAAIGHARIVLRLRGNW